MNARQDAYAAYMASPEWAERKRALFKASNRCHCCNRQHSGRRPLDAHHLTYANFGDERPSDLVLACRICHDMIPPRGICKHRLPLSGDRDGPPATQRH